MVCGNTLLRRCPMSTKAAEHHEHAAEHHEHAARHHKEAAKHHKAGRHEKAAHHAHTARGHHAQAPHHASEAAKAHTEEHGRTEGGCAEVRTSPRLCFLRPYALGVHSCRSFAFTPVSHYNPF